MIVVSNTSPLNYLLLVEAIDVLPALFQAVYVPERVAAELRDPGAPLPVRQWARSPARWLILRSPSHIDPDLKLHPGELHAIALARDLRADRLLIDERRGRQVAQGLGLRVNGVLGILDEAAEHKLIDLGQVLDRLAQTSFRASPHLIQVLLDRDARRKAGP